MELEEFENWIYNRHCCITIRRTSAFGICEACTIQGYIKQFKEHVKELESEKKKYI